MKINWTAFSAATSVLLAAGAYFFILQPMEYREEFQKKVIDPTLLELNLYSESASNLLLGTALQESCLGKLSSNIFQIDLKTAEDIKANYLAYRPRLAQAVNRLYDATHTEDWNLRNNIPYEVALARIVYLRKSQFLPEPADTEALAQFWKNNYNTYLGKGTVQQYLRIYNDKYYLVGVKRCVIGAWFRTLS